MPLYFEHIGLTVFLNKGRRTVSLQLFGTAHPCILYQVCDARGASALVPLGMESFEEHDTKNLRGDVYLANASILRAYWLDCLP